MNVQDTTAAARYFTRKGVCGAALPCFGQKETDLPIDHRHRTPGESNARRSEICAVMAWGLDFRRSVNERISEEAGRGRLDGARSWPRRRRGDDDARRRPGRLASRLLG